MSRFDERLLKEAVPHLLTARQCYLGRAAQEAATSPMHFDNLKEGALAATLAYEFGPLRAGSVDEKRLEQFRIEVRCLQKANARYNLEGGRLMNLLARLADIGQPHRPDPPPIRQQLDIAFDDSQQAR